MARASSMHLVSSCVEPERTCARLRDNNYPRVRTRALFLDEAPGNLESGFVFRHAGCVVKKGAPMHFCAKSSLFSLLT